MQFIAMDEQKIFLSYARADGEEFALRLAIDLRSAGANIWVDQLDIRGGENYNDAIEKALEAASCVLFVVSEKSIASKYVLAEVYYALDEEKKIIPIMIFPCKLPFRLRGLQHVDFTKGFENGFSALAATLSLTRINDNGTTGGDTGQRETPPIPTPKTQTTSATTQRQFDEAVVHFNEGHAKAARQKYQEAIDAYSKVIELNPEDAYAYNNRGEAKHELMDFGGAINDYTKAIQAQADLAIAYNNRGLAYHDLGQEENAIQDFDTAIQIAPNYADPYCNRGVSKHQLGKLREAIEDCNKAIALNPKEGQAHYNRATVYLDLGNRKEACKDYKKSCELGNREGCRKYGDLCR